MSGTDLLFVSHRQADFEPPLAFETPFVFLIQGMFGRRHPQSWFLLCVCVLLP